MDFLIFFFQKKTLYKTVAREWIVHNWQHELLKPNKKKKDTKKQSISLGKKKKIHFRKCPVIVATVYTYRRKLLSLTLVGTKGLDLRASLFACTTDTVRLS